MKAAYDLVVIGGGIGGGALAATMSQAGASVLVLEESTEYRDRVRGEWIAPWGVVEVKRLGLYDLLMNAGGHHLDHHVVYDETRSVEEAESTPIPIAGLLPDIPGPLCIGHPRHCQLLLDEAVRRGAEALRGVAVGEIVLGKEPRVSFVHDGISHTVSARLVVGADGRQSVARKAAGITLHQDKPHHWFAGMLVEGAEGWNPNRQAIGTEGDFAFLTFPQGDGRVRVYGSYPLSDKGRFAGPSGADAFLEAFRMACSPDNAHIASAKPAGPLFSYFNASAIAETPVAEGLVLVGDSAGWNDPILGQGLSVTYRDVRLVTDLLKGNSDWRPELFRPYVEERMERLRRLRHAAMISAHFDAEFGPDAAERRRAHHLAAAEDPVSQGVFVAVMMGPETVPADLFTEDLVGRITGTRPEDFRGHA